MANPKLKEEDEEAKLERFLDWLKANKVEFRGCEIKRCDSNKGFGIFATNDVSDGIRLVVPLDLTITPMRVLQDPLIGPVCNPLFEDDDVDDRFLMILFLIVERLRKISPWKPYLDMLPEAFSNPLWFSDDEISELKGTALYRATELQRKSLRVLYEEKMKGLVEKILAIDGGSEREVCFEDFLWGNSVFWSRALNLPTPSAYIFPKMRANEDNGSLVEKSSDICTNVSIGELAEGTDGKSGQVDEINSQVETMWVESLAPGIDFCNHDLIVGATWEVDGTGSTTGLPFSMYLLSPLQNSFQAGEEITISYGNKGNEELLYLYGFVIENNLDDYLMVHYPAEAIQSVPFSDQKLQLLEAQMAEMRCLLPKPLLDDGFFPQYPRQYEDEDDDYDDDDDDECVGKQVCSYSWSGQRKIPSYMNKFIFPDSFISALRTIAMKEDELFKVKSMLEELVGPGGERQPTHTEVRAAVWEACGDSAALQLFVDLLNMKLTELEEHSGSEDSDTDLLNRADVTETVEQKESWEGSDKCTKRFSISRNKWSAIVYRRGQKQLTRQFLREAERALELALAEGN